MGANLPEFKDRLAAARKAADQTQESLAAVLRVHKFTVSKWETGTSTPGKPSDYDLLGRTLNVSVPWLRDGEGEPGPYVAPPVVSDRQRRAQRTPAGPLPRLERAPDWGVVGALAQQFLALSPGLSAEQLGRALGLGYAMRQRGAWDEDLAREVLAGLL